MLPLTSILLLVVLPSPYPHASPLSRCWPDFTRKQRDERNTEQLQSTIKQVMEGVRSQAGHIRETVARLEGEKDETIGERDAAKKELEVCHRYRVLLYRVSGADSAYGVFVLRVKAVCFPLHREGLRYLIECIGLYQGVTCRVVLPRVVGRRARRAGNRDVFVSDVGLLDMRLFDC